MDLAGRLVIVTGASSGLGRAIALRLATREGADVILAARRVERLESLSAEIAEHPRSGESFECEVDLALSDGPETLMNRALAIADSRAGDRGRRDGLFGLVNNAGVTHYGPVVEMGRTQLDGIIDLNVRATMDLTRRFVRELSRRETDGAVLTITSVGAHVPVPYQAAYAASKHALQAYMNSLAFELDHSARHGLPRFVITSFAPGGVATEMLSKSGLDAQFSGSDGGGPERFLAPADRVAAQALRAWRRRRRATTAGIANHLTVLAGRLLPLAWVGRMSERLFRR